jgi:glycosyltransferase involved in cell wall biosynthesis
MSAHLIAAALQCLTRIPWVADFRDPWRGGPFRQIRYAGLDRWDAWLERHVFRKAARIVFASPTMTEDACRRYPFLKTKATTIINGFDGEMIEPATHKQNSSTEAFVLAHAGEFYGPRTPLPWFAALRRAVAASEDSRRAPRLLLIGPESYRGRALREIGNEAGVGEHVNVLGRLGRAESLRILAESDALVLAGSVGAGAELQIPNKLFEYLALRRPILANLPKKHPATDILRNARADAVVCEPDDEAAMAEGMLRIADRTREAPADAWSGVELFDRRHRAAQLVEVFESAGNGYGAKSSVRVNPSGTDH